MSGDSLEEVVHALLAQRGETVAVAESLTGGLVAQRLTSIPGASATFRGGVVAYATDAKASVLGVPPALLRARGAVDPEVARAMAAGVRELLAATYGLALTGVAGPDPQDGKPPGTVYVAVADQGVHRLCEDVRLTGDRLGIREGAAEQGLDLLRRALLAARREREV